MSEDGVEWETGRWISIISLSVDLHSCPQLRSQVLGCKPKNDYVKKVSEMSSFLKMCELPAL